jgi:hypothetical protein
MPAPPGARPRGRRLWADRPDYERQSHTGPMPWTTALPAIEGAWFAGVSLRVITDHHPPADEWPLIFARRRRHQPQLFGCAFEQVHRRCGRDVLRAVGAAELRTRACTHRRHAARWMCCRPGIWAPWLTWSGWMPTTGVSSPGPQTHPRWAFASGPGQFVCGSGSQGRCGPPP